MNKMPTVEQIKQELAVRGISWEMIETISLPKIISVVLAQIAADFGLTTDGVIDIINEAKKR